MEAIFELVWGSAFNRFMLVVIGTQMLILVGLMFGMNIQIRRRHNHESRMAEFRENIGNRFLIDLDDEESLREWTQKARSAKDEVLSDFFADYMAETTGMYREKIAVTYRALGLIERDRKMLESRNVEERMAALRRLYLIGSHEDIERIRGCRHDAHPIRIVAAQALGRLGDAEGVVEMLRDLEVSTSAMEQPFFAVFRGLDAREFKVVFDAMDDFESSRVQKILLITAAQRGLEGIEKYVRRAAASEDLELRIGACVASGKLADAESLDFLLNALKSDVWEVRARAARALGERRDPATIGALADAMRDANFWVRHNAATALRQMGTQGREQLTRIVSGQDPDDPYAIDAAYQEIKRHQFLEKLEGVRA